MKEVLPAPVSLNPETELLISFGMLFWPKIAGQIRRDRINVITDVETGDTFGANLIIEDSDGEWCLPAGAGGTGGIENIGEIIGQLSPEQVIAGYRRGAQKAGIPEGKGGLKYIIEQSIQTPRSLIISK